MSVNWEEWKCHRHFFGVWNHQNWRTPIIHVRKYFHENIFFKKITHEMIRVWWWLWTRTTCCGRLICVLCGLICAVCCVELICELCGIWYVSCVVSFGHKPLDITNGCHSCGPNPICPKILQEVSALLCFSNVSLFSTVFLSVFLQCVPWCASKCVSRCVSPVCF